MARRAVADRGRGGVRLAECTWPEAEALARDPRAVVLLPLGAIEQHGPHLPLMIDWMGSEELARLLTPHLVRAGFRPVLAPGLPYGVSGLAERWAGTVSLSSATLRRVVIELVEGLARHGFRRFVVTNYQADPGHLRAVGGAVRALARRRLHLVVAGFSPGDTVPSPMVNSRVLAAMRSPRPELEWHSGVLETALVLWVRPALVRWNVARQLRPCWVDFRRALTRGVRRSEQIALSGGYFGWPTAARAETGRRVMTLRARLIADHVVAALGGSVARRTAAGARLRRLVS